jgi:hypothetical protein
MPLDDVRRDVAGQAAESTDRQMVVELADLHPFARQSIVAMAHRVDQRFAHREERINEAVFALQAAKTASPRISCTKTTQ